MNILVFGAGHIGTEIAIELSKSEEVTQVTLVDASANALARAELKAGAGFKLTLKRVDIMADESIPIIRSLMESAAAGVVALAYRPASYQVLKCAIEAGFRYADIMEEYHRHPDAEETEGLVVPDGLSLRDYGEFLHQQARQSGALLASGLGFAPGLSNITIGEGIRQLDKADSAVARVGGIPAKSVADQYPLNYFVTWNFDHVIREYVVPVEVKKGGRITLVEALSDYEPFRFNALGYDEHLECAITPGMPSIVHTRPQLVDFAEKTIRWPGHFATIKELKKLGLFDTGKMEVVRLRQNGTDLSLSLEPRALATRIMEPHLRKAPGHTDVCIMWNTVRGLKDGRPTTHQYYLWEEADMRRDISAMARVTAFPAAITALMIARGQLQGSGIVAPEDLFPAPLYQQFVEELNARGIHIHHEIATG